MYVAVTGELSPRLSPIQCDLILSQVRGRVLSSPPEHSLVYLEGLGFIPALSLPASYVSSNIDSNHQRQRYRELSGIHIPSDTLLR